MIEKIVEYFVLYNEKRKGFEDYGYLTNIAEAQKFYSQDEAEHKIVEEMINPSEWKIKKLKITYEVSEV